MSNERTTENAERGRSRLPRRYLVATVAIAVLLSVVFAVIAGTRPATTDPELRFHVLRESYRLGEVVEFVLENLHTSSFCYGGFSPFSISRSMGADWQLVELLDDAATMSIMAPGETLHGGWKAVNDTDRDLLGLAEVAPGDYRVVASGGLCKSQGDPSATPIELIAAFRLTA